MTVGVVLVILFFLTSIAIIMSIQDSLKRKEDRGPGGKATIFLNWEKLRIGYNLVLLGEGLWLLRGHLADAFARFAVPMILFAIAANICYCLGPLLEFVIRGLLRFLTAQTRDQSFLKGFRAILFLVGLAFSMWVVWSWTHGGVPKLEDAQRRNTIREIRELSMGVEIFHTYAGRFPTTTEGLQALIICPKGLSPNVWRGPHLNSTMLSGSPENPSLKRDPWNHEYHYALTPQRPHGRDYIIVSACKDGKLGTADDIGIF